jgi:hypothetical protein
VQRIVWPSDAAINRALTADEPARQNRAMIQLHAAPVKIRRLRLRVRTRMAMSGAGKGVMR